MSNKTKCYDFFPGARRKLTLTDYKLLETAGGEKRQKFTVSDVLTGDAMVGLPEWISNPFLEMQKEKSLTGRAPIAAMCEGMTLEIYSTAQHKRRSQMSTGVLATSFALIPAGEGDQKEITLTYDLYVPANIDLHNWAWDHYRKVFFASFEYSQTEMDFEAKDEENEEEGEPVEASADDAQDDDPDSAAQVAARARKPFNGKAVQNAVN